MDLITREAVVNTIYKRDERLQRYKEYRNKGDRIDLLGVLPEIHDIDVTEEEATSSFISCGGKE